MALKRTSSASPEPSSGISIKQPRLISEEEAQPRADLPSPVSSLPSFEHEAKAISSNSTLAFGEPAYDSDFLIAFDNVSRVADKIVRTLETCPIAAQPDSGLSEILASATMLQTNQVDTTYIIGLIGDAGQGKSSTVNSILGHQGIAKIGDAGASVTSFVTEFRAKLTDQSTEFLLQAQIMTDEELEKVLRELLSTALQGHPKRPDYEEQLQLLSREEMQIRADESASALRTLGTIFGSRGRLVVEQCNFKQGHVGRIFNILRSHLDQIEWPSNQEDGIWSQPANSIGECQAFTNEVMHHPLATFIKIMRVYLHSPVLETGLVLADIPGLRDTNSLRVKAALRYTAYCDGVLIVNNIGRIVSNKTVLEEIRRFRRTKPQGAVKGYCPSIAVVATHAYEISNLTHFPTEYHIPKDDFEAARKRYFDSKRQTSSESAWAGFELENLHAAPRNQFVIEGLKEQDSASPEDIPLAVFCIDNKRYFGGLGDQEGFQEANRNQSGVPALQNYCATLPARQKFLAIDNIIHGRLPQVVRNLEFWFEAGRKTDLKAMEILNIGSLETRLPDVLGNACANSHKVCCNAVDLPSNIKKSLGQDIGKLVLSWSTMNYQTIKAFCRRWGIFKPKNGVQRNWNCEIVDLLDPNMQAQWQNAERDAITRFDNFRLDVNDVFEHLTAMAKAANYPSTFIDNLEFKRSEIHFHLGNAVPSLKKELDILHANLSEHGPDSYLADELEEAYSECVITSGKGAKQSCVKTLIEHTQGKSSRTMVFTKITNKFLKDVNAIYATIENELKVEIDKITQDLRRGIENISRSVESVEVLATYPEFAKNLEELLLDAETELGKNQELTQRARSVAKTLGYISAEV